MIKTTHASAVAYTFALVSVLRPPLLFTSFPLVYDCQTQTKEDIKLGSEAGIVGGGGARTLNSESSGSHLATDYISITISITIVPSYTGKYHRFVAVLYCYECAARVTMPTATFSGIAWYGDNDFIVRTFDFIAHSDAAHVTCST